MNKRTFEILAKFISEECGIKVVVTQCSGPQIKLSEKTIYLPEDIKQENALSALAALIHEAGHMKWTIKVPTGKIVDSDTKHHILNAIEDARIDNKCFRILPNIRQFYEKMYTEHSFADNRLEKLKKAPMLTRVMISNILQETGFYYIDQDTDAQQLSVSLGISALYREGIRALNGRKWERVKEIIEEIIEIFKQEEKKNGGNNRSRPNNGTNVGDDSQGSGLGGTPSDCGHPEKATQGASGNDGQDDTASGEGVGENSDEPDANEESDTEPESEDVGDYIHSGSVWGKGSGLEGSSTKTVSIEELKESTRARFIEALSVKETVLVEDGQRLNTDNLTAFFTGDIDGLFVDDKVVKKKKSKIVFALDCSGSMEDGLMLTPTKRRSVALVETVKGLTNLLDEVRLVEGLNVDYEVCAFDTEVHKLDKETWHKEYFMYSGGTNIFNSYLQCKEMLLADPETDGSKMLILVTDGCVGSYEIENIRDDIIMDNNDIRMMVVGIGADLGGSFVKDVVGNNNIICAEHAEEILMESIQTMLGV